MKQIIHIEGMTCNGCRSDVEQQLQGIPAVKTASVSLSEKEGTLEVENYIEIEELQQHLTEKYTISKKSDRIAQELPSDEPSKLQQLKPLFLILFYITTASLLLHKETCDIKAIMLDFMGLFLIVFSFFKLLDLKGFPVSFSMYDPLARVIPAYGWIYPFIETALGLMFLLRFNTNIAILITLVILSITTGGVVQTLLNKRKIQCACLGTALKLPMTEATFIENAIMIVMGTAMLLL
ncbi:heavy metal translocating P-type ATPase [Nonlabens tegetincola]|uniref:heavy metal translocating P-type ATPase n=1 Tax=Nonlabens tegetincola TaxID=323273 RepID=UPI000CF51B1C|nr:heavy-metal-associated domain-containing protein [Nonlabens tegetincola]PQJ19242.1 heavy metal transporter [Nonlabens tegetincola]